MNYGTAKDEHDKDEVQDEHAAEQPSASLEKSASSPAHISPPSPPTLKKPEEFAVLPVSLQQVLGKKEGTEAPKSEDTSSPEKIVTTDWQIGSPSTDPKFLVKKEGEGAPKADAPEKEGADASELGKEKVTVKSADVGSLEILGADFLKAPKDANKDAPKAAGAQPPKLPPVALGFGGGSLPPKKPTRGSKGGSPNGPDPYSLAEHYEMNRKELSGQETLKPFVTKLRQAQPFLGNLEVQLKTVLRGATTAVRSAMGAIAEEFLADPKALRAQVRSVLEEHGVHLSLEAFAAARGFYSAMLEQIHEINTPENVYKVFCKSMTKNLQYLNREFPRFDDRAHAIVMAEDSKESKVLTDELVEDVTDWLLHQELGVVPASLRAIPKDIIDSELTIALRSAHEMALIVKNTTDPALALEGMMGRPLSEEQMRDVRDQKSVDGLYKAMEGMSYKDVKSKKQSVLTMTTGVLYVFCDGSERYVYAAKEDSLKALAKDLEEGLVIDVRRWEDSLAQKAIDVLNDGVTIKARRADDPTKVVEISMGTDKGAFKSVVGVSFEDFRKTPCKYLFDYQIAL